MIVLGNLNNCIWYVDYNSLVNKSIDTTDFVQEKTLILSHATNFPKQLIADYDNARSRVPLQVLVSICWTLLIPVRVEETLEETFGR